MKRSTKEEFIQKAIKVHGNLYNYDDVVYINNATKVKIWCNICEDYFEQGAHDHLGRKNRKGRGCPICNDPKLTTEEFIQKARERHGNLYDYSDEYIGTHIKIRIYCKKCEDYFEQSPNNHINGNYGKGCGCPICGNEKIKLTTNYEIINRLTVEENPIVVGGNIQCKCTFCKEYFIPTRVQLHNRTRSLSGIYTGENRLYCSDTCKNLCPIFGKSKHPEGFKVDTSRPDQPELREMVLERDNFTCQRCGTKDTDLFCHHFEGVELNPIESADINNCITLCKDCHNKTHDQPGCTYNDFKRKPCKI